MKLDLSNINFSKKDIEKGIIIPDYLTKELAEDIGIHVGDGSLYRCNNKKSSSEFFYSFNIKERKYLDHVLYLKKKLYNLKKFRVRIKDNEIRLIFNSKAISDFYNKIFEIPIGKKSRFVDIPNIIKEDKNIITSFLRGLLDTDFSLYLKRRGKYNNIYPILSGTFASKKLVLSISECLDKLNINHSIGLNYTRFDNRTKETYKYNKVTISGNINVNIFFNLIGFNNQKYNNKIKKINGPNEI